MRQFLRALAVMTILGMIGTHAHAQKATQYVTVYNAKSGAKLSGASVSVTNGSTCYAPKTTGSSGQVSFTTTGGIKTVAVSRSGYSPFTGAINASAVSYSVYLNPLPSKSQLQIRRSQIIASYSFKLMKFAVTPKYKGQTTVKNVLNDLIITTGSVGAGCWIWTRTPYVNGIAATCVAVSGTAWVGATGVQTVYQAAKENGLTDEIILDVYYFPVFDITVMFPAS